MEKDKVESRTDNENTSYYKEVLERQGYIVSRPSVPQQGQALSFKEWGKDKFEIDDTHVLFKDVQDYGDYRAALAASRSEAATAQDVFYCGKCGQSLDKEDVVLDAALARIKELEAGAPAAGSTERLATIQKCAKAIEQDLNNHKKGPYREGLRDAMRIVAALAGTDTDVAKGE